MGAGAGPGGTYHPNTLPAGYCLALSYQTGMAMGINSLPPVSLAVGAVIDDY